MKSFAGRLGRWEKSKAGNSLVLDTKSGEAFNIGGHRVVNIEQLQQIGWYASNQRMSSFSVVLCYQ